MKAGLTDSQDFAYCNSIDIKRTYCTETLNPSSCAQAYTAAVLPTPDGPIMSTVLHSSCSWSMDTASPSKSPQSHDSTGKEICTHISQFQELKKKKIDLYNNCMCSMLAISLPLLFSIFILLSSCRLLLSSVSALIFHSFNQLPIEK